VEALIELDDHTTEGRLAAADSVRVEFYPACPSSWYRDIVNDAFR
jgi:hypothetical protein